MDEKNIKDTSLEDLYDVYIKNEDKDFPGDYDFIFEMLTKVFNQLPYLADKIMEIQGFPLFAGRFPYSTAKEKKIEFERSARKAGFSLLICKLVKAPKFKKSNIFFKFTQKDIKDYHDVEIDESSAAILSDMAKEAEKLRYAYLTPETLLLELLTRELPYRLFDDSGIGNVEKLIGALKQHLSQNMQILPSDSSAKPAESKQYKSVLLDAARYGGICIFFILVALYAGNSFASQTIRELIPKWNIFEMLLILNIDGREDSELIAKRT